MGETARPAPKWSGEKWEGRKLGCTDQPQSRCFSITRVLRWIPGIPARGTQKVQLVAGAAGHRGHAEESHSISPA